MCVCVYVYSVRNVSKVKLYAILCTLWCWWDWYCAGTALVVLRTKPSSILIGAPENCKPWYGIHGSFPFGTWFTYGDFSICQFPGWYWDHFHILGGEDPPASAGRFSPCSWDPRCQSPSAWEDRCWLTPQWRYHLWTFGVGEVLVIPMIRWGLRGPTHQSLLEYHHRGFPQSTPCCQEDPRRLWPPGKNWRNLQTKNDTHQNTLLPWNYLRIAWGSGGNFPLSWAKIVKLAPWKHGNLRRVQPWPWRVKLLNIKNDHGD